MVKKTKKEIDREVDKEFESKTKEELKADFARSPALHVPAKKKESVLISIRLPMTMISQLREVALQRGDIGYQQLIKVYLADRLERESTVIPLPSFQTYTQSPFISLDSSATGTFVQHGDTSEHQAA